MEPNLTGPSLWISYVNHRGEWAWREIKDPQKPFVSTNHNQYHPAGTWLMQVWCMQRNAWRYFAMQDIVGILQCDPNLPVPLPFTHKEQA